MRNTLDWREPPRRVMLARNRGVDGTRTGPLVPADFAPLSDPRWLLDTRTYAERYMDIPLKRRVQLATHVSNKGGVAALAGFKDRDYDKFFIPVTQDELNAARDARKEVAEADLFSESWHCFCLPQHCDTTGIGQLLLTFVIF